MQRDSIVKNVLYDLCCSYGWCYGVFWSFDRSNYLFLTMQDAYYEEKLEGLIENIRIQIPMLGGGIIGQAAFTKKHQWKSIENPNRMQDSSKFISDMFMDDSEFDYQFASGIKTIAAIPVDSQGVVQFGSTEKITETEEFVYQTQKMFQEIVNAPCSSSNDHGCFSNFTGGDPNSAQSSFFSSNSQPMVFPNDPESRPLEPWNPILSQFNTSLPLTNNHHDSFDSFPDFGILQTTDFDISQWIPTESGTEHTTARKGLFSKLGIGEILEGISGTSNATIMTDEKVYSVGKRRKTGNSIWEMSSLQSVLNNSLNGRKEAMFKSAPSLYNLNRFRPQMAAKKKAKPGTRPRPKDRQQILDRMAELRELIPNGEKMSIDCLLDRTIKHMVFLESITKHADRIKEADEQKNKKDNDPTSNGVTWACELSNQTILCPLIVEDLGTPGQMLIEMLCEENGFFLEMVDVIRGFGVTILKGVMEVRDKIWARFIVETEAKRHVSRHEIFSALVQLLEVMCINDNQLHNKVMESGNLLLDNVYCIDL